MPEYKSKVFVNARFEVIWEKLIEKIYHPQKYVQGIVDVQILEDEKDHVLRLVRFDNPQWQSLKELIVHQKSSGLIVYQLVDHPHFHGETVNICRTTNQVYLCELEYQIDWKLKETSHGESEEQTNASHLALDLAVNEMKRISEEAEAIYARP